jgi:hypothetical protein
VGHEFSLPVVELKEPNGAKAIPLYRFFNFSYGYAYLLAICHECL